MEHTQNWLASDSNASGVSWGAVIAGAFGAAALSLILLALGTGVGFSAVSPWSSGASASTIGWGAVIWLILMQLVASSMGGYLAGRLRTKWVDLHTHEVYFRDTAHGFLAWAVALVITAAFLASAATSLVSRSARSSGTATEAPAASPSRPGLDPGQYFVDMLLRPNSPTPTAGNPAIRQEVGFIFANGLREGGLPSQDKAYLAAVVTANTGASESDAENRVSTVFQQFQENADAARKGVAHSMYWTFLALLIGAFCASLAATLGGRQRDRVLAT
jgi:hypothetical protein